MAAQPNLRILYSAAQISATVKRIAAELACEYRDKNPLFIGILKGSFVFLSDLVRQLDFPLEIDFVTVSSYGICTQTSGKLNLLHEPQIALKDRYIILIEDIVDTGLTTGFILDYLKKQSPASVRLCALLDKPERRQLPVKIDCSGLKVPNKFLVGYGLDCAEKYRNLPGIYILEEG